MRRYIFSTVLGMFLFFSIAPVAHASGGEAWLGVDEAVVAKYAEEHGRPPKAGLIDLDGDALIFVFLLGGAAGGFVMGYCYRDLVPGKGGRGHSDAP